MASNYGAGCSDEAINLFLSDLVGVTTYAKRKEITREAVYAKIKIGKIKQGDLVMIDDVIHIRWSQYQHLKFQQRSKRK